MKPRFLLDEHVNRAIQRQLYRLDSRIDVLAINDPGAPSVGTSDPDLLFWLEENGYILITENRSTIPIHLADHYTAGRHVPGVFWIRPGARLGAVIEERYLIWYTSIPEMLGVTKYSSFDLNEKLGAIPHDLNLPLEDASLYGQYDLVTDHGCNEHAFNIAEAYRTMHRLCKQQGIMVIEQAVYGGNGYYTFDVSFFEGNAAANNYEVLFSSYVITTNTLTSDGSANQFHIPASRELLDVVDWSKVRSIGISYVLQKQLDSDFQYPYQGHYLSVSQGHYGYQLRFLPDPPSRTYVPVYNPNMDLNTIRGKVLLRHLCVRLIRKVGLLGMARSIIKVFR